LKDFFIVCLETKTHDVYLNYAKTHASAKNSKVDAGSGNYAYLRVLPATKADTLLKMTVSPYPKIIVRCFCPQTTI